MKLENIRLMFSSFSYISWKKSPETDYGLFFLLERHFIFSSVDVLGASCVQEKAFTEFTFQPIFAPKRNDSRDRVP